MTSSHLLWCHLTLCLHLCAQMWVESEIVKMMNVSVNSAVGENVYRDCAACAGPLRSCLRLWNGADISPEMKRWCMYPWCVSKVLLYWTYCAHTLSQEGFLITGYLSFYHIVFTSRCFFFFTNICKVLFPFCTWHHYCKHCKYSAHLRQQSLINADI